MGEAAEETRATLDRLQSSLDLLRGMVAGIDTTQKRMRAQQEIQAAAIESGAAKHDDTARILEALLVKLNLVEQGTKNRPPPSAAEPDPCAVFTTGRSTTQPSSPHWVGDTASATSSGAAHSKGLAFDPRGAGFLGGSAAGGAGCGGFGGAGGDGLGGAGGGRTGGVGGGGLGEAGGGRLHQVAGVGATHADVILAPSMPTRCSTLAPTAATVLLSVQGCVPEATNSSPPPIILVNRAVAAAALRADEFLSYATPRSCSTVGSAVSVGSTHGAVALPTSDITHLPTTTLTGLGNITSEGVGGNDPAARTLGIDANISFEVLTCVGGFSLFHEFEKNSADEAFNGSHPKDVLWYEEFVDCVITHIGSSSLFLELSRGTNQELQGQVDPNPGLGLPRVSCGTMIVKLEKLQCVNNQCIHRFGHTRLELPGNFDVVFNCTILRLIEEMDGSSSLWDPGGSSFACPVLNSLTFAGHTRVYFMNSLQDGPDAHTLGMDTDMYAEVLTHVRGFSLFQEFEQKSAYEVFTDCPSKDVLWYEELANCVVTCIGSSSLFLEQSMDTQHELDGWLEKPTRLKHGIDGVRVVFPVVLSEKMPARTTVKRDAICQ